MLCLRCPGVALREGHGALHEAVCPSCQGRLLDGDTATRLLEAHCGLDRAMVGELSAHFRGRTPCPGCGRAMSLVPVLGVSVDLCGACGSLFLDAGELARLTRGAVVEVEAVTPPSAAPAADVGPAVVAAGPAASASLPAPRPPGRDAAVFLAEPLGPTEAALLLDVWQTVGFRTVVDARAMLPRAAGGIFADDCSAAEAAALVKALAERGRAAAVVDDATLLLPLPYRLKTLEVDAEGLVVQDALGRPRRLAIDRVQAVCAGRPRIVATEPARGGPGPGDGLRRMMGMMGGPGLGPFARRAEFTRAPQSSMVEREMLVVDIVVGDERFRLDEEGFIARAGGASGLADLAFRLAAVVPPASRRHRGLAALLAGQEPPAFRTPRELDREVTWAVWQRHRPRAG